VPANASGELLLSVLAQMRELRASLDSMRDQLNISRQESSELRHELETVRQQLDAVRNAPNTFQAAENLTRQSTQESEIIDRASALSEEQELLNAKVEDQYQTKVESGSKYRVRLSGLALMNAVSTHGSVDSVDLPRFALPRAPGDSRGSFAASARQSRLDLQVFGPELNGAKTTGSMSFDFWGGFPSTSEGVSSGLVRLRTAKLALDSAKTSVVAGQDVPFFSPRSPTSLASSAYPPLASAGNLWTWTPQIHVERRIALSDNDKFSVQAGILDPLTGELPGEYDRIPTAGERSRVPAYATRLGWQRTVGGQTMTTGTGGYYSRQNWGFGRTVDAWAVTADWDLPVRKWLSISGESYRGRAIGGLGAGASGSVLFKGPPLSAATTVLPLNSVGGWLQLKVQPTERIEFNTAFGEDQPFRSGLGRLLIQRSIDGSPFRQNASGFVNVIYQARSNLLFSVEYRRLWTSGFYDPKRNADHLSLTTGIVF
jgi:hypothetical protein